MSDQKKHSINIDSLTITLASGWQGDPTYLARKISDQIRNQAAQLNSCDQMAFSLKGPFAGHAERVSDAFSSQLTSKLIPNKHWTQNKDGRNYD
jgi:hypothetical protein